jgi:hypothetical protein
MAAVLPAFILAGACRTTQGAELSQTPSKIAILHCRNTASGTIWSLAVDFEKNTVDSFPAQITPDKIVWHDTDENRYYSFTRASGILNIHYASSTGGFSGEEPCWINPLAQNPPR